MQLSDHEIRDINKLLQAGKPLPDKYRFLLFDDDKEVELVWNGKTEEVSSIVLPFQTIEHIDEPRSEEEIRMQQSLFDTSGHQIRDWTNKLIWGDNKLILSSLKNGPLRKEIEAQGGIKLIYIDPPFDVGADFSMDVQIGDEEFTKKPSIIEEIAYRDTWGKGADSFIAMIYERLSLMHDLMADDGSIYVHCDYRVNGYLRFVLDELFGKDNFRNEIYAKRKTKNLQNQFTEVTRLNIAYDSIFWYSKNSTTRFRTPLKLAGEENLNQWNNFWNNADRPTLRYPLLGIELDSGQWRWTKDKADAAVENYKIWSEKYSKEKNLYEYWVETGKSKRFIKREEGATRCYYWVEPKSEISADTNWGDIYAYDNSGNYPTQKSEALLERIIKASSNEGDLVADFFCGSGTTLAVAERLSRKWIGSDLGRFAIHTTRKRMIGVQRELKKEGKNFRAFEILNIGKYEREQFIGTNDNLREEERQLQQTKKEKEFIKLILSAYKAELVDSFLTMVGKKRDRLVAIGPINFPVSADFLHQVVAECIEKNITKVDVLGFDWEMGLDVDQFKNQGVDLQLRVIPREVFDKRAVENGQVKFYEVAFIEVKPIVKKNTIAIELSDFSVFYNQDDTGEIEEKLSPGGAKVVIENGQVIKLSKAKDSDVINREVLTTKWTDWVDYWAVDYNFESKKEVIRLKKDRSFQPKLDGSVEPQQINLDDFEETWTGNYIFENEWQSFRTKKDRSLELISASKEVPRGRLKAAVKVVDIFGNDTTKVIEVTI